MGGLVVAHEGEPPQAREPFWGRPMPQPDVVGTASRGASRPQEIRDPGVEHNFRRPWRQQASSPRHGTPRMAPVEEIGTRPLGTSLGVLGGGPGPSLGSAPKQAKRNLRAEQPANVIPAVVGAATFEAHSTWQPVESLLGSGFVSQSPASSTMSGRSSNVDSRSSNVDSGCSTRASSDKNGGDNHGPSRSCFSLDTETGLYHEKQVKAHCGLHCVNNLFQGPFFDEDSFRIVAEELDKKERELTGGSGLDNGNALRDGWFNVQVMQAVLLWQGYEMVPVKGWAVHLDDKECAYIFNRRRHWFAIRRINQEWFDLNSCLDRPRLYEDREVLGKIKSAIREGYSVFVVRGDFPEGRPHASMEEGSRTASSSKSSSLLGNRRRLLGKADRRPLKEMLQGAAPALASTAVCYLAYFFTAQKFLHRDPSARPWASCAGRAAATMRRPRCCCRRREEAPPEVEQEGDACRPLPPHGRGLTASHIRDFDLDVICRGVAEAEAKQDPKAPSGFYRPRNFYPIYVVLHVMLYLALWVSGVVVSATDPAGQDVLLGRVGLETVLPGRTLLALTVDCRDLRPEAWRWFTYQFTVNNLSELVIQVLLMLIFGISVEGFFGHAGTILIYHLGQVVGGACHLVCNAQSRGLSNMIGGCVCLLGVHVADLVMNWRESEFRKLTICTLACMLFMVGLHADVRASQESLDSAFAKLSSPLGGLVTGLAVGAAACQGPGNNTEGSFPAGGMILRGFFVLAGVALAGYSMALAMQWPPRTPTDPAPWCWMRQVHNESVFHDNNYHCVRCGSEECASLWSRQERVTTVDPRVCQSEDTWVTIEHGAMTPK